ncbi:ABC transporter permease [Gramella sp. GC03-9]|uniref:ABC transporter permease n=1 Tax=Christiangramia oceanisediminis TaxID=2920386 RepID=A0A9X2KZZ0_9FLAO|nr:ABC transporter permease [Gramella oceanisediminis]MCP9201342.1 ABC transporter permease [Gramella oceanisediminis]
MESIKNLFRIKDAPVEINDSMETDIDREQIRITYYQSGFAASTKASGKPIVLQACLQNLFSSFEDQCRRQNAEQEKLKQPYREEQEKLRTELKKLETGLSIFDEKEIDLNKKIESVRHDIVDVKNAPEKYGVEADKRPRAQFYIGLAVLLPITLYLLVFYISASYSAFFKEFTNDVLTAAIFDKDALNNAFEDSWLEGLLVITIPFVFMGLGYVIHMMQKGSGFVNYLKLAALLIITFLFDGLLAYQIEKKIYDFNRTLNSPDYNLEVALGQAEFWMIIFAGFVVYIIWGLVFDFIMKEHENLDKIKVFINNKKEQIKNLERIKEGIIIKKDEFKNKITEVQGSISEIQSKINGFIFPIKEYLLYHNQYKEGWFQAINTEIALPNKEKEELLSACDQMAQTHLKEMNLSEQDFQHLVYSKN